jgi:AcrR family transcriptional regulator
MTRKEREKLQKRNEILSAALTLFAEKGFENTTLDEIAEASEFGKGTLYNYFRNKSDIFKGIVDNMLSGQYEMVKEIAGSTETFSEFIKEMTIKMFNKCGQARSEFLFFAKLKTSNMQNFCQCKELFSSKNMDIEKIYLDKITEGQKNGELKNYNPVSIINIYRSALFSYLFYLISRVEEIDFNVESESQFFLDVLFNGIIKNQTGVVT